MSTTDKKIGLIGFGTVGQGFYQYLLANNKDKLLPKIAIKNTAKKRPEVAASFTDDIDEVIKNQNSSVLVELISDDKEAFNIVSKALKDGKKVISANKKMIAHHLETLIELEQNNNGTLLYEGAVLGSIPILKTLNDYYLLDNITQIDGIFNGSTNYILTQIFENQMSYQQALKKAQQLGFAEADPNADVSGSDALYKLLILAAHAFGKVISPEKVLKIGIQQLTPNDIQFALEHQLKVKLIAHAQLIGSHLHLSVLPTFVAEKDQFYHVDNEYNAVAISSENIGNQLLIGKGAGSLPTGQAVYSDYNTAENFRYQYAKLSSGKKIKYDTDGFIWLYSENITALEKYIEEVVIINRSQGYAKIKVAHLIKLQTTDAFKQLSVVALTENIRQQFNRKYAYFQAFQHSFV